MIRSLHDDRYYRLDYNATDNVYRIARKPVPFDNLAQCEAAYEALERAVPTVARGSRLLLDVREAPPRNDDAFEAITRRTAGRLLPRFTRVAILIRLAVGRLQIERMTQGLGPQVATFDDEDRAFEYLLS